MTRLLPAMICVIVLFSSYFLPASAQGLPGTAARTEGEVGAPTERSAEVASELERLRQRCKENPQECEELKAKFMKQMNERCNANPQNCRDETKAGAQQFAERCKANPKLCEEMKAKFPQFEARCIANPKQCDEVMARALQNQDKAGAQPSAERCRANPKQCEEMKARGLSPDGRAAKPAPPSGIAAAPKPEPVQKGPIAPSLVPARTTGVAPLAVFFDATGTTGGDTAHPFHELEYRWDFGDPTSGNWKTTGLPKNKATGPVSAHVFETPGTYTIKLTVVNATQTANVTTSIVVSDPNTVFAGANTICVAAARRPVAGEAGCPAGADVKQSGDWPTIVNTFATAGKRVLLNRGEVYTGEAAALLNKRGPGIIGAYGSGAKPVIQTTAIADKSLILRVTGTADDWRLMDLDIDGQADIHRNFWFALGNYTISRVLLLRLDVHDLGGGIAFFVGPATPVVPDQITLADSTIQRINTEKNVGLVEASFWMASRLALLGNLIDDTTKGAAEHLLRVQYADRAVFSHNILRRSHDTKEMFGLRSPCSDQCNGRSPPSVFGAGATKFVLISSNQIKTNTYVGVQVDTGQGSAPGTAIIHDVILERNWYQAENVGAPAVRGCIAIRASRVTVRNEICDVTNAPVALGINVFGPSPHGAIGASDVWIYNNTFYSGASQDIMAPVMLTDGGGRNLSIRNNLAYAPKVNNSAIAVSRGGALGAVDEDHNSIGKHSLTGIALPSNQIKDTFPLFASRSPAVPSDFALRAGSYAIDAGAAVPVFSDFFGVARPQGAAIDIGAVERTP